MAEAAAFEDLREHGQFSATRPAKSIPSSMIQPQTVTVMTAMVSHDDCRLATVFSWWILDFIPGGNFCRGVLLSAAALSTLLKMHPLFFAFTPGFILATIVFLLNHLTFRFSLFAGVFECSGFVVGVFLCCAVVWLLLCLCRCCCVFFCSFHVC